MGITKLANGKTLSPVTRTGDDSDHGAPLNPVKVQDAIGDLVRPGFFFSPDLSLTISITFPSSPSTGKEASLPYPIFGLANI